MAQDSPDDDEDEAKKAQAKQTGLLLSRPRRVVPATPCSMRLSKRQCLVTTFEICIRKLDYTTLLVLINFELRSRRPFKNVISNANLVAFFPSFFFLRQINIAKSQKTQKLLRVVLYR